MNNLNEMSREQLIAIVGQLKADNQRKLSCKVTSKDPTTGKGSDGAISVYGLGRFPVTLYASQWERLSDFIIGGALARFIEANAAIVSRKD